MESEAREWSNGIREGSGKARDKTDPREGAPYEWEVERFFGTVEEKIHEFKSVD